MQMYMSGITNQHEIARQLKISQSLVHKDLKFILEESRTEIHNVISNKLPLLWKKTDELLSFITTEALRMYRSVSNPIQKMAALNLVKDTAQQQFELSANSTILGEAMNFVASHSQTLDNLTKVLEARDKQQQKEQQDAEPKDEDVVEDEILSNDLHEDI